MKGHIRPIPLTLTLTSNANQGSPDPFYAHINVPQALGMWKHCR